MAPTAPADRRRRLLDKTISIDGVMALRSTGCGQHRRQTSPAYQKGHGPLHTLMASTVARYGRDPVKVRAFCAGSRLRQRRTTGLPRPALRSAPNSIGCHTGGSSSAGANVVEANRVRVISAEAPRIAVDSKANARLSGALP